MQNLSSTDLVVDQIYGGSRKGNYSDDPLHKLLGVDNGAGFRVLGQKRAVNTLKMLVLKSNFNEPDWPDHVDTETGILTYYGDNRKPGDLHTTPRLGNQILNNLFAAAHSNAPLDHFPPIFIFGGTGNYRDLRFLGLAVPGTRALKADEDLVALWRATGDENIRFQNYRAKFTILSVPVISRAWIHDIQQGSAVTSPHAPKVWLDWVKKRKYTPLAAPHNLEIRTKKQQLPSSKEDMKILNLIYATYEDDAYAFEKCALEIAKLMMPSIIREDLTRPWRDGGRDAMGTYQIGEGKSAIEVEFSLEAKRYKPSLSVGVKATSRLISRLRHRQFGILVTTSYLHEQAYKELKEDKHPVVVICGKDIVDTLKNKFGDTESIKQWLAAIN